MRTRAVGRMLNSSITIFNAMVYLLMLLCQSRSEEVSAFSVQATMNTRTLSNALLANRPFCENKPLHALCRLFSSPCCSDVSVQDKVGPWHMCAHDLNNRRAYLNHSHCLQMLHSSQQQIIKLLHASALNPPEHGICLRHVEFCHTIEYLWPTPEPFGRGVLP